MQQMTDAIVLTPKQLQAIQAAKEKIGRQFPIRSFILYGSYARGEAGPNSDIDLFILTERTLTWQERDLITDILFDINMEFDTLITSLVSAVDKWESPVWSLLPIYQDIREQGVAM